MINGIHPYRGSESKLSILLRFLEGNNEENEEEEDEEDEGPREGGTEGGAERRARAGGMMEPAKGSLTPPPRPFFSTCERSSHSEFEIEPRYKTASALLQVKN